MNTPKDMFNRFVVVVLGLCLWPLMEGSGWAASYRDAAAGGPAFTTAQSITDEAQRTTLAFAGLGMMTGSLEAQTFFPPGKVADYTGFQYLRDNDPDSMGHNTSFLTRVANNIIYILNDSQFNQLKTLAVAQQTQIGLYGYKRFPLMKAFRRLLEGDIPAGSAGLNLNAVKAASRELYLLDGQISFDRAVLYAGILNSLTSSQRAYLDAMKGRGWNSWPDITQSQIDSRMKALPQGTAVAVMTYAGDLFSWYAGSVEADVYFCPERHGTYFGSFYIKDAPAIGHEGYGINEQLTATAGAALCDSSKGYVTSSQAAAISGLVETQRNNLYASPSANIVQVRTAIATLLRSLLNAGVSADAVKSRVLSLSETYGDLDGENNHAYATVFAQVYKTLTADQKSRLSALRKSIMSGTYSDGIPFDFSVCTTYFLYSSAINDPGVIASCLAQGEELFFEPSAGGGGAVLYFPHVATVDSWQTEIGVINTGAQAVTGTLKAYSNAGQAVDSRMVTIAAHGRRQIHVANEFTSHANIGYIVFDASSDTVRGYTKFYIDGHYRAAIPAAREVNASNIHIPHIASTADWWTGLSLVNTTSATKVLTVTFNNGQSRQVTLNAGEHRAFDIASLFNNQPQPAIQSAVISGAGGVIGVALFGGRGQGTQLEGILLSDRTASTLYYPHVANEGWWTGIVAYNPSDLECTVTMTPYSAQGAALAPSSVSIAGKGRYAGTVETLGLPGQTAWFRIDSTRPLSGFELFGSDDGRQLAAYVGLGGTGSPEGIFPKIEKNGWTGIAFVNAEAVAASITLTAYNDQGTVVATKTLTVAGHAKVVSTAEALFSKDIGAATFIAYTSSRNLVGLQLNGSADGTMLEGLPAL